MNNKEWIEMAENKYDEIFEKLEEAVEIARDKDWGTVDVIIDQDGLLLSLIHI